MITPSSPKIVLDEVKICQLVAVLEKMWPDVKAKPKLALLQGGKGIAVPSLAMRDAP